jgi:hypothetical protein
LHIALKGTRRGGCRIDPRRTFADLIEINVSAAAPVFRVIDVKATRRATVFQKAQVAYYALMLSAVLEELGVSARIDPVASIWRIPDDGTAEGSLWKDDPFELGPSAPRSGARRERYP